MNLDQKSVRTDKINVLKCEEIGEDKYLEEHRFDVYQFDCSCGQRHFSVYNVVEDEWLNVASREQGVEIAKECAAAVRKSLMN